MTCHGSVYCPACGGVCSQGLLGDEEPYIRGLHQRRLAEEAEAQRGEPEPDEPAPYCRCTGPAVEWPTICPASGRDLHILRPSHREDIG